MWKSRALAGLCVDYVLGDVGLTQALRRVKDGFNSYHSAASPKQARRLG